MKNSKTTFRDLNPGPSDLKPNVGPLEQHVSFFFFKESSRIKRNVSTPGFGRVGRLDSTSEDGATVHFLTLDVDSGSRSADACHLKINFIHIKIQEVTFLSQQMHEKL